MTWAEFKQRAEAAGVTDDDPIAYIDWNGFPTPDTVGAFMFGPDDGRCGSVGIECSKDIVVRVVLDGVEIANGR